MTPLFKGLEDSIELLVIDTPIEFATQKSMRIVGAWLSLAVITFL